MLFRCKISRKLQRLVPGTLALCIVLGASSGFAATLNEVSSLGRVATEFAGRDVGDVSKVRGNIAGIFQGLPRTLNKGSDVKFLDTLLTGNDSRAEIILIDDSVLKLGDNSELTIDEMVYEPGERSRGALTLTRGVFRMVSGKINKTAGGTMTVYTPLATIGVRGTDFWGLQEKGKLTMALIDHGSVVITGADGHSVTLSEPLQAIVIELGKPTPSTPFSLTPAELAAAAQTVTY